MKRLVILSLFVLLFVSFASGQYYYEYGGDFFGVAGVDILTLYEDYQSWIDFFIFLLIFLGLTKAVFGEHFKGSGGKAVTIGVGVALALGFILWERRAGFTLITLGPIGLLLFSILIYYLVFLLIDKMGAGKITSVCLAYVALFGLIYLMGLFELFDVQYELFRWMNILFVLALIGGAIALFYEKKQQGATP